MWKSVSSWEPHWIPSTVAPVAAVSTGASRVDGMLLFCPLPLLVERPATKTNAATSTATTPPHTHHGTLGPTLTLTGVRWERFAAGGAWRRAGGRRRLTVGLSGLGDGDLRLCTSGAERPAQEVRILRLRRVP